MTNSGAIGGATNAIFGSTTVNVTNSGSGIIGSLLNTNGIKSNGAANVTNFGSITGSDYGIFADGTANVTNSGTIFGGLIGIATNGTADVTNSGTITGAGPAAILFGDGTLTITPTSVINGNVVGGGSAIFQLGGSGSGSFDASLISPSQQYVGFSTFNKVDDSIWTLTGTNTLPWTVQQGMLIITGDMTGSPFTVNNGGALSGTGTVGDVTVNTGGIFAPGPLNVSGAITVNGNLSFQSGSFYLVRIGSTASMANVSGSATLTGGTVKVTGPLTMNSYDILHATGGFGGTTFDATDIPNYSTILTYTSTDVLLTLNGATLGAGMTLSVNQQHVADGINSFLNNGGTAPAGFGTLFGFTGNSLSNALSQLSGEAATGAQQTAFQLMNEFFGLMFNQDFDGKDGAQPATSAIGYASETPAVPDKVALASYASVLKTVRMPSFGRRWRAWASGFGGYNETNGDASVGSHNVTARTYGGAAGLDYRVGPNTLIGLALAGAGSNWGLADGLGGGHSDDFQAGLYGRSHTGAAYVAAAFVFANHWMSTDRHAQGDHLTADFTACSFGGRIEGGYRLGTLMQAITPYAALQAQSFHTPGYNETDLSGGGFGLSYASNTATDTRSELGARFDEQLPTVDGETLSLSARAAWAHDWVSNPSLSATFQALPGASFIVNGAAPPKDSALVTAGVKVRFADGVTLLAKFDGDFAGDSQTYAGTGTLRYMW